MGQVPPDEHLGQLLWVKLPLMAWALSYPPHLVARYSYRGLDKPLSFSCQELLVLTKKDADLIDDCLFLK
ncbi:MAG TPA: hypothetical protein VKR06_41785 [Ktedonosporobacter sp.]|nr:hypothetical protein [Ktedonosporobacter sp.]